MHDYRQESKNQIRHIVLSEAVNRLTVARENSCCVPRTYVRHVIDYFIYDDPESSASREVKKITPLYLNNWEKLHDSVIGHKRPEDLNVCYFAGPQPENDFNELIGLGILPQNIWAFENNNSTYLAAIKAYNTSEFPQPRIVKMGVE